MSQVQSLPGQQNLLPATPSEPAPVKTLLKDFAKQPGLDSYSNAGDRIMLLTEYLWLRQLTPSLPFETFLQCFAPLADYNEENRKHPEDSLKFHCPRRAKAVGEGGHQWTAAEIVDFTILYVDMVREAERTNQPIPLTFDVFLERLGPQFLAGAFNEPEPPAAEKAEKQKRKTQGPVSAVVIRPTVAGQRILYTMAGENGRQERGKVEAILADSTRQYVTFMSDSGERFEQVNLEHCQVIDDPVPPGASDQSGKTKELVAAQSLTIPKSVFPTIQNALALATPMGNVAIGDSLYSYTASFGDLYDALIDIINGETGPFVDARLVRLADNKILSELPPRKNIDGMYHFATDTGIIDLEVKVRQ